MKKSIQIFYCGLVLLLLCLPAALFPFFRSDARLEKRALAELPAYVQEGRLNQAFADGFESWVSDHLPLRARLLTVSNRVKGELLRSRTANVIAGKDGWLFFASEADDYMDTHPFTDDQVTALAVTLDLLREQVEAGGGRFVFVPMPDKSAVYPEYMPGRYRRAEQTNLTRVQQALAAQGVPCADMLALLTAHREEGVYHRRDSHWNYRGALYGYEEILSILGREQPDLSGVSYTVEQNWQGDLDKLLLPAGAAPDLQIYYDYPHADFRFTYPQGVRDTAGQLAVFMSDREERDDRFSTRNSDLHDGSRLLMVRDSFGRALLPWMIDSYEEALFRRMDRPDLTALEPGTDVVYEIAQRNLARVIQAAPFAYAPVREGIVPPEVTPGRGEAQCQGQSYGFHLWGALPQDTDMGSGRVYLLLEQQGRQLCVEAFPVREQQLPEGEGTKGFSAYLPRELGLSGSWELTVFTTRAVLSCGTIDF